MTTAELEAALAERVDALEEARDVINRALGWEDAPGDDDADAEEDDGEEE